MISKKIAVLGLMVVFFAACTEVLPPMPRDAVELDAGLSITSQDSQTGNVVIEYTLFFKNISDETLENEKRTVCNRESKTWIGKICGL
ncbi:MAG: hypothetical protein U9N35_00575 [Euryarchaeota archaeon]|nr:hypothetical protein [Euryarchaeota archaeon]